MFNRRGLKSRSKVKSCKTQELMFADDCTLVAYIPQHLQNLVNSFAKAAEDLGLKLNVGKTEVMCDCAPTDITLNGNILKETPIFKYLESIISKTGDIKPEMDNRLNAANREFGQLYARVCGNPTN